MLENSNSTLKVLKQSRITENFYIKDLGYYPTANNHCQIETKGVSYYTFIYCIKGEGSIVVNDDKNL
jgi:hypothetical protein